MRARTGARVGTIGVLAAAGILGTAAVSWAHHPEVAASTDCGGVVHFTSTAWTTTDTAARTNPTIGISYSINNGYTFISLPQLPAYHFGADNNYSFGDTFTLHKPLPSTVIVRATALAKWANGASAGAYRQTQALNVESCPAVPSATIGEVDCSADGAVPVRLTNDGDLPAEFTISGPDDTQHVSVPGHGSVTQTVTPAEDSDAAYAVSADGMTTVNKTVHRNCVEPKPVAALSHDCDGIHAVLANTFGSQDAVFTVTTSDGITEHVTVAPGESNTRIYSVAEGTTRTVTVSSDGMTDMSETFTRQCAPQPPVDNGDNGATDGPSTGTDNGNTEGATSGTSTGTTDSAHPTTSGTTQGASVLGISKAKRPVTTHGRTAAPQVRSASSARQLPFTGTNTLDLLTAGLLSLVLGTVLTSAGRRRGDVS
jgi:hypothetical protein